MVGCPSATEDSGSGGGLALLARGLIILILFISFDRRWTPPGTRW